MRPCLLIILLYLSCPINHSNTPKIFSCPETKRPRDECVFQKGEEHCGKEIAAHNDCLRKLGFKVGCYLFEEAIYM